MSQKQPRFGCFFFATRIAHVGSAAPVGGREGRGMQLYTLLYTQQIAWTTCFWARPLNQESGHLVCVCVYIYIYMCVCVDIYMYMIHTHIYIYICIYIYIYIYTYIYIYSYIPICINMYIWCVPYADVHILRLMWVYIFVVLDDECARTPTIRVCWWISFVTCTIMSTVRGK